MIETGPRAPFLYLVATLGCLTLGCGAPSTKVSRVQTTPEQVAELCAEVPGLERERPTFLQPNGIEAIRPFMGERRYIKFSLPELRGAEIIVAARPGVTKQWVARVLRCHMAVLGGVGAAADQAFEDPLTVGVPDVSFSETETAFVIRIAGRDKAEGEEILRRAQRLTQSPRADARE